MAAPSVIDIKPVEGTYSPTSYTPPMPAGMGGTVMIYLGGWGLSQPSTPSGWTLGHWTSSPSDIPYGVWYAENPTSMPTFTLSWSIDSGLAGSVIRFNAIGMSGFGSSSVTSSTTSHSGQDITTNAADTLVMFSWHSDLTSTTNVQATLGLSDKKWQTNSFAFGNDGATSITFAFKDVPTAGTTITAPTWTATNWWSGGGYRNSKWQFTGTVIDPPVTDLPVIVSSSTASRVGAGTLSVPMPAGSGGTVLVFATGWGWDYIWTDTAGWQRQVVQATGNNTQTAIFTAEEPSSAVVLQCSSDTSSVNSTSSGGGFQVTAIRFDKKDLIGLAPIGTSGRTYSGQSVTTQYDNTRILQVFTTDKNSASTTSAVGYPATATNNRHHFAGASTASYAASDISMASESVMSAGTAVAAPTWTHNNAYVDSGSPVSQVFTFAITSSVTEETQSTLPTVRDTTTFSYDGNLDISSTDVAAMSAPDLEVGDFYVFWAEIANGQGNSTFTSSPSGFTQLNAGNQGSASNKLLGIFGKVMETEADIAAAATVAVQVSSMTSTRVVMAGVSIKPGYGYRWDFTENPATVGITGWSSASGSTATWYSNPPSGDLIISGFATNNNSTSTHPIHSSNGGTVLVAAMSRAGAVDPQADTQLSLHLGGVGAVLSSNATNRQHQSIGITQTLAPLATELVSQYAFDEGSGSSAEDSSGNGYDISVNSSNWATGHVGYAVDYNATATAQALGPATAGPFTWMLWYKKDDLTDYSWMIHRSTATGNSGVEFGDTFISYGDYSAGEFYLDTGYLESTIGTWYHLAVTMDNSGYITIYRDGTVVAEGSGGILQGQSEIFLGSVDGTNNTFPGTIDELRVFNNALTSAEVNTWMNTPVGEIVNQDATVTAVRASATTAANVPVVSAVRNTNTTVVAATGTAAARTPTLSSTRAPTVVAVSATASGQVRSPSALGGTASINMVPKAQASTSAGIPTVAGTSNATVVGLTATAISEAHIPAPFAGTGSTAVAVVATGHTTTTVPEVLGVRNQNVVAPPTLITVSAIEPVVSGGTASNRTAPRAQASGQAGAPTVSTEQNPEISAVPARASVLANTPDVSAGTASTVLATEVVAVALAAVPTVSAVRVANTEAARASATTRAHTPSVLAGSATSVNVPKVTALAETYEPSVSAVRNVDETVPVVLASAQVIAPTASGEETANVIVPHTIATARASAPDGSGIANGTVSAIVATGAAYATVPAKITTGQHAGWLGTASVGNTAREVPGTGPTDTALTLGTQFKVTRPGYITHIKLPNAASWPSGGSPVGKAVEVAVYLPAAQQGGGAYAVEWESIYWPAFSYRWWDARFGTPFYVTQQMVDEGWVFTAALRQRKESGDYYYINLNNGITSDISADGVVVIPASGTVPTAAPGGGLAPTNGVFTYDGMNSQPTDSYMSSAYYVDIILDDSYEPATNPITRPPSATGSAEAYAPSIFAGGAAFVGVVTAEASALVRAPEATGERNIDTRAVAASASATALAPTLETTQSVNIGAVPATATTIATVPSLTATGMAIVSVPKAGGVAQVNVPGVLGQRNAAVSVPAMPTAAEAYAPVLDAVRSTTQYVMTAGAEASAPAPRLFIGEATFVAPPAALGYAGCPIPTVVGVENPNVQTPTLGAVALALSPTVQGDDVATNPGTSVWDGTTEIPASVTIWNGSYEVRVEDGPFEVAP